MKISVITVAYNAEKTISNTIKSVVNQSHDNIEYIIVDGGSSDGTVEIIKQYAEHIQAWVSEPDQGIYDAMNKGITMATGDVIGILNADDVYAHQDVLDRVEAILEKDSVDVCFADLQFINDSKKVVRHYSSARFQPKELRNGWMPAHPTLYVKKDFFEQVGEFRTDYKIAADYEWIVRAFLKNEASWEYVHEVWVYMGLGGVSTKSLKSSWILNNEIVHACRENGIKTNIFRVLMKFPVKVMELFFYK